MLRTQLPEHFKQQLSNDIAALDDNADANKTICENLTKLEKADSLDELFSLLKEIGHRGHITAAAKSTAIQNLVLANPDAFIQFFTRDNIKALIHQACVSGNLQLAACLIEKIKLDVTQEKVASPFGSSTHYGDGTYEFSDKIPVVHAAAKSTSLALMQYVISFYDLAKLDKTSITGDLQNALAVAAEKNAYDVVEYLLKCGVNVNSKSTDGYSTTALYYAVIYGSARLVELLVENGATIDSLNKTHAIKCGKLDVVKYFASKGQSFENGSSSIDSYIMDALESRSVAMVRYFLETLKLKLYPSENDPSEETKRYYDTKIIRKVARSGSIDMIKYIEDELNVPVSQFIKEEIEQTENYHHMRGDFMVIDAVCSYNVNLLKFLFETRGLKPDQEQLDQLLGYAYNCGSSHPQHKKLTTHAYVYSFLHANPEMQKLLAKLSETENLRGLANEELFMLYADYTRNFQQRPRSFRYTKFRENSTYLANEIMRRKLSPEAMLEIAQNNNGKRAADIQFFLIVSGECNSYQFTNLLKDPVFAPNHDFGHGQRPLHYAIHYQQTHLLDTLLAAGADPDIESMEHETPITQIDSDSKYNFNKLLAHANSLTRSLYCSIKDEDSSTLLALLKHLNGDVAGIDLVDWLKHGLKCPENLFNVLCNINADGYAKAKEVIPASGAEELTKALAAAEHFKTTGKKPKELVDYDKQRFGASLIHSLFGGGCCGGRVLEAMAMQALQNGEIVIDLKDDEDEKEEKPSIKLT